jgi:hypothetical protein
MFRTVGLVCLEYKNDPPLSLIPMGTSPVKSCCIISGRITVNVEDASMLLLIPPYSPFRLRMSFQKSPYRKIVLHLQVFQVGFLDDSFLLFLLKRI